MIKIAMIATGLFFSINISANTPPQKAGTGSNVEHPDFDWKTAPHKKKNPHVPGKSPENKENTTSPKATQQPIN